MKFRFTNAGFLMLTVYVLLGGTSVAEQEKPAAKPNIILILSDDFGYGDSGVYGGGPNRGMPTPNIDRLASEGMTFFTFYAQPSCTPGRAAVQTGRIPNRSGMTTVAFQGQGGGLPAAEWTLASVLKQGGYQTFFTGKWHLGEADYDPTAVYIAGFDSHQNLLTRTPAAANAPNRKGPYPCRRRAWNANAPTARTRTVAVIGNRYLADIKNPNPTELNRPA